MLRNLSFDSNEEEIKDFFKKFGKIRYCRIVIDPTNDYSRGMYITMSNLCNTT